MNVELFVTTRYPRAKLRRLRGPFDHFALLGCSGQIQTRRNPERSEEPQSEV